MIYVWFSSKSCVCLWILQIASWAHCGLEDIDSSLIWRNQWENSCTRAPDLSLRGPFPPWLLQSEDCVYFSLFLIIVICPTQWGHVYIQKSKWLPIVPHPRITQCPIPNSSFFGTSFLVNNSFHHGCCAVVDSFLIWINLSVIGISTNLWVIVHMVSSAYSEMMNLLKCLLNHFNSSEQKRRLYDSAFVM